jgi:hypothetical protein
MTLSSYFNKRREEVSEMEGPGSGHSEADRAARMREKLTLKVQVGHALCPFFTRVRPGCADGHGSVPLGLQEKKKSFAFSFDVPAAGPAVSARGEGGGIPMVEPY